MTPDDLRSWLRACNIPKEAILEIPGRHVPAMVSPISLVLVFLASSCSSSHCEACEHVVVSMRRTRYYREK